MPRDASLDSFFTDQSDGEASDERPSATDANADRDDGDASDPSVGEEGGRPSPEEERVELTDEEATVDPTSDGEAADPSPDEKPAEPATSTYQWSPDGPACDRCGDAVDQRWRDDDAMVCGKCKDW